MYKCLIGLTHCLHLPDLLSDRQERDFDSSAISWAHNIAGVVNPCNSELVSFVKEGALRFVGHFVNKNEPITPEILRQIVLVYGNVDAHLKDLRFACMCFLCFSGFLRFSELANLKRNNVIILLRSC